MSFRTTRRLHQWGNRCRPAGGHRIREALAVSTPTGLPVMRLSAGVLPEFAPSDLPTLIQRADSALYDAKRSGRDRTVIFKRESDEQPLMHHEGAATRRYRDHRVGHQPA